MRSVSLGVSGFYSLRSRSPLALVQSFSRRSRFRCGADLLELRPRIHCDANSDGARRATAAKVLLASSPMGAEDIRAVGSQRYTIRFSDMGYHVVRIHAGSILREDQ